MSGAREPLLTLSPRIQKEQIVSMVFHFPRPPSVGLLPRLMVAFMVVSMLAPMYPATGAAQDVPATNATPAADGVEAPPAGEEIVPPGEPGGTEDPENPLPDNDPAEPTDPGDGDPAPPVAPEEGNALQPPGEGMPDAPASGETATTDDLPEEPVEPASTPDPESPARNNEGEGATDIVHLPDDAGAALVGTPEAPTMSRSAASTLDLLQASVHITNYDQARNPLGSVQFQILEGGTVLGSGSTAASGVLTIHELPTEVDLVVRQVSAPTGCVPVPDQSFRVDGGGPFQARLTFVNDCGGGEAGSITVTVRDQAGTPLEHVEAIGHYFDGVSFTNFLPVATDGSGMASIAPVYVGFDYEVRLRSLPVGCMTPVPQAASVTPASPHHALEFVSECSDPALTGTRLGIVKHDQNNVVMAGIDFEIWQGSTLVTTGTTNHMGQIGIEYPPAGPLVLRETNAPAGCIDAGDTIVDMPVGGTVTIRIENDCSGSSGEITVRVVDQYGSSLSGVTFRMETGTRIHGRWTTDPAGEVTVAPLTLNQTYEIIHETGGCRGWGTELAYLDEADPQMTVVVESFCADATPPPADLLVVKTDESGSLLPGADFALSIDGTVIASGTTDAAGEILFAGLTPGETYLLQETAAPEGCTPGDDLVIVMPADGTDLETNPVNTCGDDTVPADDPTPTDPVPTPADSGAIPEGSPTPTEPEAISTPAPTDPGETPDPTNPASTDPGTTVITMIPDPEAGPSGAIPQADDDAGEGNSSNGEDADDSTDVRELPKAGSDPGAADPPFIALLLGALAVCLAGMGMHVTRRHQ